MPLQSRHYIVLNNSKRSTITSDPTSLTPVRELLLFPSNSFSAPSAEFLVCVIVVGGFYGSACNATTTINEEATIFGLSLVAFSLLLLLFRCFYLLSYRDALCCAVEKRTYLLADHDVMVRKILRAVGDIECCLHGGRGSVSPTKAS